MSKRKGAKTGQSKRNALPRKCKRGSHSCVSDTPPPANTGACAADTPSHNMSLNGTKTSSSNATPNTNVPSVESGPSSNDIPVTNNDTHATDDGDDGPAYLDRSLTDMLASALEPVASDQSSASQQTPSDQIVLLQSQLALAKAQIDKNVAEKQQLVNMSELLEGVIDDIRKIIDNQKKEIKRINRDNDTIRRELSHFRGIRRYTTENSRHKSDTDDGAPTSNTTIKEELDVTKTKLISLREHIMDIAGSLLTAVDEGTHESSDPGDSDEGFQEVMSRRQRHFRLRPNPAVTGNTPRPSVASNTAPPSPGPQHTQGQPIPVIVSRGFRAETPIANARTYSDAVQSERPPGAGRPVHPTRQRIQTTEPPSTYVIGTSLTRGLGGRLNKLGVNNLTHTYAGAEIPLIRSRVPNIFPSSNLPTCVVLQCGGNDSERRSAEAVIQQYDALIDDVQYYCPTAHIVISKVPLRGNNTDISRKINEINKYLENRATRGDGVIFIDACPQSLSMFKKDLVHFNSRGMRFYAQSMCNNLTNFTRSRQQRVI